MSRATEYNHCRLVTGVLAFAVAWCVSYGDTNRSAPSATRDTLSRDTVLFNVTKEIAKARQSLQAVTVKLNQAEVRLIQIAKNIQKGPEHRGFLEHKLVHLDFNGAPPRMSYLLELVPFLRSWGATGFLIEYVDMFPFTGNLQFLTSQEAYSREEILQFQSACSSYGLIVIPLVQTFGHLEYALRHPRLAHLRETARYTNVLCPNKEGSVPLIKEIIDQVADLHPHSQWLHVGGDEVYNLKTCESCKMDVRNKSAIFLHHMLPVLRHVSNRNLSAIIWDDMMRDWELPQLSLMKGLVEPMLWGYKPTLQGYFSQAMLERYVAVFPRVWLASAFKGAHKPFADFVPIRDRLDNNLKYLELATSLPNTTKVMGIALTGWSRYDYFGTLCELLPAGIPSLVICLTALNRGLMDDNLLEDISSRLGFKDKIDIEAKAIYNDELCNANFPGHEIYKIVCKLSKALHALDMTKETEKGWMLHRQLQSQALSYFRLESARKQSVSCISNMRSVRREAMAELPKIYFNSTVKEWIQDKVNDNIVEATKSKMIIERVQSDFDMLLKQEEIRAKKSKNEQTLPSQDLQNGGTLEKQLPTF